MADEETTPEQLDEARPPETKVVASSSTKWLIFAIVAILSLAADQGTKIWARTSLSMRGAGSGPIVDGKPTCVVPDDIMTGHCQGSTVQVVDSFWHWRLSMNPGSAFGLFAGQTFARVLLSIIGIGAVFGMLWMLKKSRTNQKILHWGLALVAGGAVGNLIDRIYYGVVTDFILWHWGSGRDPKFDDRFKTEWPVFNVADIVLVAGVILMFIDSHIENKAQKLKRKKRDEKGRKAGLVKV
jgi:signal peptidase II